MAYSLQFNASVIRYLRDHPGLSREDRVKLFTAIDELRDQANSYRQNVDRRLAPDSPYFWLDFVLLCKDGRIRNFWFLLDDSAEHYGVLRVEYADEGGPGRA